MPEHYTRGIGAIQIRLLGAGMLATVLWILFHVTR
jgi:hypothetical protein